MLLFRGAEIRSKKTTRSFLLFSLLCTLLATSCATVNPKTLPDFGTGGLKDNGSLLSLASLTAEYVTNVYSRIFLYSRIAEEYLKQGDKDDALEILRRGVRLSEDPAAAANRHQVLTELARFYIEAGDNETAKSLLQDALDRTVTLSNETQRGQALEAIIVQCFSIPDDTGEILRSAIDNIYIIDDPVLRVQLLTDLGQRYQDLNVRNRADNLLQQAIAAAASIDNPWAKAEADTLIAKRFKADQDQDSANLYADMAISEINSVDVLAISPGDAQILLRTLTNLADFGRFSQASAAIDRLPDVQTRISAQLSLVDRFLSEGQTLQARLLVQRLLNQLDQSGDKPTIIASLVRLAEIYRNVKDEANVAQYVSSAVSFLEDSSGPDVASQYARLAILDAGGGKYDEALALANEISDSYVASQTIARIAELRNSAPANTASGTAPSELIALAEKDAQEAQYLKEPALAAVAVSAFRTGQGLDALRILSTVGDPYTIGASLADSAASRAKGWTEDEFAIYKDILAKWLHAPLPKRSPRQ